MSCQSAMVRSKQQSLLPCPRGRPPIKPSAYDDAAIDALCQRLVSGMGMNQACKLPECPSRSAVYERLALDEQFQTRIARVREIQQYAVMDDIVDMADAATPENWQVVKLRIWARQWTAAKLAPKIFGDKRQVELNSAPGIAERLNAALARYRDTAMNVQPPVVEITGECIDLPSEFPTRAAA
jgi:hypothetical protein